MSSKFECIKVSSRSDWLAMRQQDVTASVAGALLGVHDYVTPYALWAQKAGRLAESEENAAMKRGRLLEPVAIELIKEAHPAWSVEPPGAYYRDPAARIGATPDLLAVNEQGARGIVQIKTVAPNVFFSKWKEGDEVQPPLWIAVQAIIEAHLTESEWAAVAALVVGNQLDLRIVPVPIHAGVIERVREAVAAFWHSVAEGKPPSPDYARDGEDIVRRLVSCDDGSLIDLSGDNALPELCAEHAKLSAAKTAAEKRIKAINAEILDKMGTATTCRFQGGLITARTISRAGYSVKASSYRTPRISFQVPIEGDAA